MKKYFRLTSFLVFSLIFLTKIPLSNAQNMTSITFDGQNASAIFSVEKIFPKNPKAKNPQFYPETGIFSGNFYFVPLGDFVSLDGLRADCQEDICQVSGKIAHPIIGEITPEEITFNKKTGEISGKFHTMLGSISLENIRAKNFTIELESFAHDATINSQETIRIKNPDPEKNYVLQMKFEGQTLYTYSAENGVFSNVDMSRSGNYALEIRAYNSENQMVGTDTKEAVRHAENAKKLTLTPLDISNAQEKSITIFLSDSHGNAIEEGNLKITFRKSFENTENSTLKIDNEASIDETFTIEKTLKKNIPTNFFLESSHPGKIILEKILLNNQEIPIPPDQKNIIINGFVIPKISIKDSKTSDSASISLSYNGKIPSGVSNVIVKAKLPAMLASEPIFPIAGNNACSDTNNTLCLAANAQNFLNPKNPEFIASVKSAQIYGKTETFVSYEKNEQTYEYAGESLSSFAPSVQAFGLSRKDISNPKNIRRNFLNEVSKNVAYLSRNVNDYVKLPYQIENSDYTIDNDSLTKNAYISVGGDIYIKKNIEKSTRPIAIIALEKNGLGGNIYIDGNVTNINAALVAEKEILSNPGTPKNRQLYIFGSVYAKNACEENTEKCLWALRSEYDGKTPDYRAKGISHSKIPIIVRYDERIRTLPPP